MVICVGEDNFRASHPLSHSCLQLAKLLSVFRLSKWHGEVTRLQSASNRLVYSTSALCFSLQFFERI